MPTWADINEKATMAVGRGDYETAEKTYRALVKAVEAKGDGKLLAKTHHNLATVLHAQEKEKEAERHYRKALALGKKHFGAQDQMLAFVLNSLSELDVEDADELLDEAGEIVDLVDDDDPPPSSCRGLLAIGLCPPPIRLSLN